MIQKILLATDGSSHAFRAAEKTVELAKQLGQCGVTLIHVSSKIPSRAFSKYPEKVTHDFAGYRKSR